MKQQMKPTLKTLLNESTPVQVQFTKLDGSIRDMKCTTNHELIPVEFHPKQKESNHIPNDNIVCAYDLENNGWRSFIVHNVISYNKL